MTFWLPFLFGAFIGSFLNVCIHRLPRNESVVQPPSRCYACGTRLAWYDNVPLLGWLLLRGRCRYCGTPFGASHLIGEAAMALATGTVVWWSFQRPHADSWLVALGLPPAAAAACEAAVLLLFVYYIWVAAAIDAAHTIIPDELTKPMQVLAPLVAVLTPINCQTGWTPLAWFLGRDIYAAMELRPLQGAGIAAGVVGVALLLLVASLPLARRIYSSPRLHGGPWPEADHRAFGIGVRWFAAVVAAQVAMLLLAALLLPATPAATAGLLQGAQALLGALGAWWLIYLIGLVGTAFFRRNAMGYGDVKFLAPIGALLGPVGVLYAFFLGALVAALIGITRRLLGAGREIPFGPYLAMGAVLAVPLGPWLTDLLTQAAR